MFRYLVILCAFICFTACQSPTNPQPEPHLVLGQRISFVGGNPNKTYVVAGYREQFEDKTESNWNKQAYIVYTYFNDQGDFSQGVIHKDAVIKQ